MLKKIAIGIYLVFAFIYLYILVSRSEYVDEKYYKTAQYNSLIDIGKSLAFPLYVAYDYYYKTENNLFHKKEIYIHNNHEIQKERAGASMRINIFSASGLMGSGYDDNNDCRMDECLYADNNFCKDEDVAVMEQICKMIEQKQLPLTYNDYGHGLLRLEP